MDKLKLVGALLTVLLLSISTNAVANGFKLTELKEFNEHKEECFLALNNGHSVPITFSGTHKVDDENLEKVDSVLHEGRLFTFHVTFKYENGDFVDWLSCRIFEIHHD